MVQVPERNATFVTHLGAGPAPIRVIAQALAEAPILIAVDGGVAHAALAGHVPTRIIGDMDSQPDQMPDSFAGVPVTHIAEQESTDFDKALRSVACPLSLGVGFLGGRVDHELACFHSLATHPDRRAILLSESDAVTLLPPDGRLSLPQGTRVSLFPLGPVRITSRGLRWPLRDDVLDPMGRIGTSNETTQDTVAISASEPACLLIVPASALGAVIDFRIDSPLWRAKRA